MSVLLEKKYLGAAYLINQASLGDLRLLEKSRCDVLHHAYQAPSSTDLG